MFVQWPHYQIQKQSWYSKCLFVYVCTKTSLSNTNTNILIILVKVSIYLCLHLQVYSPELFLPRLLKKNHLKLFGKTERRKNTENGCFWYWDDAFVGFGARQSSDKVVLEDDFKMMFFIALYWMWTVMMLTMDWCKTWPRQLDFGGQFRVCVTRSQHLHWTTLRTLRWWWWRWWCLIMI